MSQLTKQQLTVENNSSFPNNNSGYITPELLRTFNQDMIDSTVNQTVYTTDSASFDSRINAVTGSTPAGTISGSQQITDLGFVQSSITGSSLITASFASQTLTFTKGDGSTFGINIPDVSGSTINTGSFAVTGSNTFLGNQTITGSLSVSSSTSPGVYFKVPNGGVNNGFRIDGRVDLNGPLHASQTAYVGTLYVDNHISKNGPGNIQIGSNTIFTDVNNPAGSKGPINAIVSGSLIVTNSDTVGGSFTSSLQEGYVWVGGPGNVSITAPTSSFGGGGSATWPVSGTPSGLVSGSSQVSYTGLSNIPAGIVSSSNQLTSSFDGRYVQTGSFQSYTSSNDTKWNTIGALTGSYATTGSNSFNGNQTITGSLTVTSTLTAPIFSLASVSTNAVYPIPFQSGSTLSKDSVDTLVYNPSTNVLSVSASNGQTNITNQSVSAITGSGNLQRISNLAVTLVNNSLEGGYIGFSGNPSKIGPASLASNTNPGFLAQSGSTPTFYVPLEFQPSASFTDGRVTANRLFRAISGIELTGSLNQNGTHRITNGNLELTGSLLIQSSSVNLPQASGSGVLTYEQTTGQVKFAPYSTLISASFDVGGFQTNVTNSGSANVSQSINLEVTDVSKGISIVSGSRITVQNGGTYLLIFSAQLECSAGADTVWIWLKKNGTNVAESATKAVMANNTAQTMTVNFMLEANASDYFEIVWQNLNGNAVILAENASGNYPAIPAVIVTVNQVH